MKFCPNCFHKASMCVCGVTKPMARNWAVPPLGDPYYSAIKDFRPGYLYSEVLAHFAQPDGTRTEWFVIRYHYPPLVVDGVETPFRIDKVVPQSLVAVIASKYKAQ